MADKQQGCARTPLDFHQQFSYRCLYRYIKGRYRLICNHDTRIAGKSPGNTNTLFLPSGKLARHSVCKFTWQFHKIQQLQHFLPACFFIIANLKYFQSADNLAPDAHRRVQGVKRVLKNHLNRGNCFCVTILDHHIFDILTQQFNLAAGRGFQPHQHLCQCRFTTARFANNRQSFGFTCGKTYCLIRLNHFLFSRAE